MAEMSMVERVAKAFYHGKPRNKPWSLLKPEWKRQYEKQARAAIEAMREPSNDMEVAGGLKCERMMFEGDPDGTGVIFTDMGHVYRQMIEAALSQEEG